MTRSRKGNGRRRGGRQRARSSSSLINTLSGVDRVERVPGKVLIPVVTTLSNLFTLPLTVDALGPRLATLGSVFQEHRYTEIRIVLHPGFGGANRASYAVGYFKVIPQTPPAVIASIYSGSSSRYHDLGDTVPVTMVLNRSVLLNNVRPWYVNNTASGTEASDYTQGVVYVLPSNLVNGLTATLEISYVCEFRGPTLPAVD
jgi:hypothetical protein